MHGLGKSALLAAALSATAPAIAGAQAQKCDIPEGKPYQVASARQYLSLVQGKGKEDEKAKHLRNTVKVLTDNADRIGNPAGRNFLLGQAYLLWLKQKDQPIVAQRGAVGFSTNPQGTIDLLAAADSAFSVVESAMPECKAETEKWRRPVWVQYVNGAVEALNGGQTDSAEVLARRALMIYRDAPHSYNILASVAQKRNDAATALEMFRKTVETSGTDTAYAKMRNQAQYNVALALLNSADTLKVAEKTARLREAETAYRAYLAVAPADDPNYSSAQQGLARALRGTGDTTAVKNIYADMLANPAKYSDIQLFEAGAAALSAKNSGEAVQLIEAGLTNNPYYRDALSNLATAYFNEKKFDKMLPIAQRLVQVDPNSPSSWRALAAAYQGKQRAAKDTKLQRAFTDSVIRYVAKSDSLPAVVNINQFMHQGAKHTVSGTVENNGKKAGTYTIKFEFLDKSGTVVASETANVGPVEPRQQKDFTVSVDQAGIVAFRYAPVT